MNLLNILLQAPVEGVDSAAAEKLNGITNGAKDMAESLVSDPGSISKIDWGGIISDISSALVSFGLRLLAALVCFYLGKFIIKKIHNVAKAVMTRRGVEPSLNTFLLSLVKISLMFVLIITCIAILGIETSSFIAIFASAGVAIGMALSGTLQNFAGGVLILLLKPYKVGDFIVAEGFSGTVKEIQIFNTVIITPNNERVIIPNGGLSTNTINNYSGEKYRRLEWKVSISYGDSIDTAREVILGLINAEPLAYSDETMKPSVSVDALNDSSVDLIVRGWCAVADYWTVYYNVNEKIYNELPKHNVNFPFPQMDVHMK